MPEEVTLSKRQIFEVGFNFGKLFKILYIDYEKSSSTPRIKVHQVIDIMIEVLAQLRQLRVSPETQGDLKGIISDLSDRYKIKLKLEETTTIVSGLRQKLSKNIADSKTLKKTDWKELQVKVQIWQDRLAIQLQE